ncbi:MAG: glycosyltransferase family 4 protein [Tepidisphaeraceae bacterium]|jgi:glycosyltransferase involved in cell wall biosynthesis
MGESLASFPIAYVAAVFPRVSETFVYREVRGLRKRGWSVTAVSLNPAEAVKELEDLERDRVVVYGREIRSTLLGAARELFAHPIRSAATLGTAIGDAIWPGERLSVSGRLKLPMQAIAGMGLARRLRQRGVRHVHCHFAHAPTSVGMYAAMQMGIPFSFTGHANDIFQRRAILKTKLRRARFVACISRWHQSFYNTKCADMVNKYEVIRCGVEAGEAKELSPGDGQLRILTVCRLVEKKGIDTLIGAAAELNRRGIHLRLTIAGEGPDRQRLEKLAAELGCGQWLAWLGAVANSRVFSLLKEADVLALPCREDSRGDRDGIPVVLMEAMASGTPVVAGNLPAIGELVEDGVSGLLVEGNKPAALADKLAMLWANPDLSGRLAEEGRRRIATEFSLGTTLDLLERRFVAGQNLRESRN